VPAAQAHDVQPTQARWLMAACNRGASLRGAAPPQQGACRSQLPKVEALQLHLLKESSFHSTQSGRSSPHRGPDTPAPHHEGGAVNLSSMAGSPATSPKASPQATPRDGPAKARPPALTQLNVTEVKEGSGVGDVSAAPDATASVAKLGPDAGLQSAKMPDSPMHDALPAAHKPASGPQAASHAGNPAAKPKLPSQPQIVGRPVTPGGFQAAALLSKGLSKDESSPRLPVAPSAPPVEVRTVIFQQIHMHTNAQVQHWQLHRTPKAVECVVHYHAMRTFRAV
jgi:hypothetical protein